MTHLPSQDPSPQLWASGSMIQTSCSLDPMSRFRWLLLQGKWGGIPSRRTDCAQDPALRRTPFFFRGEKHVRAFVRVIS